MRFEGEGRMSGQLQLSPRDLENVDSFVPFGQSPGAFSRREI